MAHNKTHTLMHDMAGDIICLDCWLEKVHSQAYADGFDKGYIAGGIDVLRQARDEVEALIDQRVMELLNLKEKSTRKD